MYVSSAEGLAEISDPNPRLSACASDPSDVGARYALIVSVHTPPDTADVWTPVANQVGITIPIVT